MKKYICKFCGKKFDSERALEQHIKAKHEAEKGMKKINLKSLGWYLVFGLIAFGLIYSIYFVLTSPLKIGPLGSQHICADFAVYINGKPYFFNNSYFINKNAYINIQPPYFSVIQMHATNVPLDIFFKSIKWKISNNCLILHTGEKYCNNKTHTLRFYVNGKRVKDISSYVFKNLDKILIVYGNESEEEIKNMNISDLAWRACSI